jgi:SAM-dependent methyltransferase
MASSKLISKETRDKVFFEDDFKIKVNLGCGHDYLNGWVNVDYSPEVKTDICMDLDSKTIKIPLNDCSVDLVFASHILEHIRELIPLKKELARIMAPGAKLIIIVPYYTSMDAWGDDTHVRAFSEHSFFPLYWDGFGVVYVKKWEVQDSLGNKNFWLIAALQRNGDPGVVSI